MMNHAFKAWPLTLLIAATSTLGQVSVRPPEPPPQRVVITPLPEWTIKRSQSEIELLPQLRVQVERPNNGDTRRMVRVQRSSAQDTNIGGEVLGVVYDHGLQAYGALTGEISFQLRPGLDTSAAEAVAGAAGLRGARRLGRSDFFVVRASSPEQLRDALQRLRVQPSVLEANWVVNYNLPRKTLDAARTAAL